MTDKKCLMRCDPETLSILCATTYIGLFTCHFFSESIAFSLAAKRFLPHPLGENKNPSEKKKKKLEHNNKKVKHSILNLNQLHIQRLNFKRCQ